MARLKIVLPPDWQDVSAENPSGPSTFCRRSETKSGALQISIQAEYKGGVIPNPKPDELIQFAETTAHNFGQITLRGRSSGKCAIGIYGTVLVSASDFEWVQVWVLSNSRDFVLATHTCSKEPSPEEVEEASTIVNNAILK